MSGQGIEPEHLQGVATWPHGPGKHCKTQCPWHGPRKFQKVVSGCPPCPSAPRSMAMCRSDCELYLPGGPSLLALSLNRCLSVSFLVILAK